MKKNKFILKNKSKAKKLLIFIGIVLGFGLLQIITQPKNPNSSSKNSENISSNLTPPPLPTAAPVPLEWKTYLIKNFNLTSEIATKYPKIAKGDLIFKYPESWQVNEQLETIFTNENKYGVIVGPYLIKEDPDHINELPNEGPRPNTAIIRFYVKQTTKTPNDIVEAFGEEFGHWNSIQTPEKNVNFNGYKAAMMRPEYPVPGEVIASLDQNTILDISVEFINYALDEKTVEKKYVDDTVREINQILSNIRFEKSE